ncbi:rhodanese-like domain-containing protein [Gaopeijia maritima]|uniref:Rhodanese-like domain-containing protein n=1 Tax=Gaopeijia maritima TaxID=3119007 RepID=A0ABU9E5S3_9BACT
MSPGVPEIEPTELKARMDAGDAPVLLDVREPYEKDIADLPEVGQLRIPLGDVAARFGELSRDDELVVYCRSGGRSGSVVQFLQAQGFDKAINLRGGVLGWQEDVDPSLTRY